MKTLVARQTRKVFVGFVVICFVTELPQKRDVSLHKNLLPLCQQVLSQRQATRCDVSFQTLINVTKQSECLVTV